MFFLPKESLRIEKVFSSYRYATTKIIRSSIHLFEIIFSPTIRSSAVSLPTYPVSHFKQKTKHIFDCFNFLSLSFEFFFDSFHIIERKANNSCRFISYSSYKDIVLHLKCRRRYFQIISITIIATIN